MRTGNKSFFFNPLGKVVLDHPRVCFLVQKKLKKNKVMRSKNCFFTKVVSWIDVSNVYLFRESIYKEVKILQLDGKLEERERIFSSFTKLGRQLHFPFSNPHSSLCLLKYHTHINTAYIFLIIVFSI